MRDGGGGGLEASRRRPEYTKQSTSARCLLGLRTSPVEFTRVLAATAFRREVPTLAPNAQDPAGTQHDLSRTGLLPTDVYIDRLICDHRDSCAVTVTKATLLFRLRVERRFESELKVAVHARRSDRWSEWEIESVRFRMPVV